MCIPKNDAGIGFVGGTRWTGLAKRLEGGAGRLIWEYPVSVRPKVMQKTRTNIDLKTRAGAFIVESPRNSGYPAEWCNRAHPGQSCIGIYTRRSYAGLVRGNGLQNVFSSLFFLHLSSFSFVDCRKTNMQVAPRDFA